MLIHSVRHCAVDLQLWQELADADMLHGERLLKSQKIARSLDTIHAFVSVGGCYCGVSWGKDSVVVAHLLSRSGVQVPLVHLRVSPSHNFHCDDVRDVFLSRFPAAYSEIDVDYGTVYSSRLTDDERDHRTDALWFAAFRRAEQQFGSRHISGVRASESGRRMIRMRRWGLTTENTCCPIGWWSEADVFGYLAIHQLPIHPNYAMLGNGRWPRDRIRVAEIGDVRGNGCGRAEWEREYYGDVLNRLACQ